ncbi:anthranilate phosphoribosyltransferase [Alkalimonas mucilaginosa]|uniref:Anthranilate phosphoribosyltransferase n=1 Tax=Alkalimonas mucilaginosa TaxID=3057676 RepID=A0ABU7JH29_9GAMM|nr:anthranilate phosphoribosyltransferase [Alkalimonas sp. MEB004]MEE2024986.1 anthranilate phosphoribosyltransferase [Alkalimonas sp. MEB004]
MIAELVQKRLNGGNFSQQEAQQFFSAVVAGEVDPIDLTAVLVAGKLQGIQADEVAGAAQALRAAATPFPVQAHNSIDCCGTGGDGSNTINISTTAAIVAAAAGLSVAKHGNRSVSSKSGSADLLESLGVNIQLSPEQAAHSLQQAGCAFLFAPLYHAGIRHAMPVRQQLKTRTLFNVLGPLLNPAAPGFQLLGVYDPALGPVMAQALGQLDVRTAWVVHGSGCDEIALHGPTEVTELHNGVIRQFTLTPADFGLPERDLAELAGGDPAENAAASLAILQGKGLPAHQDAIAVNVAAMMAITGVNADLKDNVAHIKQLLSTDQGYRTLQLMKEASHG